MLIREEEAGLKKFYLDRLDTELTSLAGDTNQVQKKNVYLSCPKSDFSWANCMSMSLYVSLF